MLSTIYQIQYVKDRLSYASLKEFKFSIKSEDEEESVFGADC